MEENKENQVAEEQEAIAQEETQEQEENTNKEESLEENELEIQLAEAKDKYLRLYSEFENFRRRTSKEKLDLINTANKQLMVDLIPVIDDFERASGSVKESDDIEALKEGFSLIQNKLTKALEVKGLKKMKVEKADAFDEEQHEAITQIPMDGLEGKIVDVVEAGYTLNDTIVRFAKVVVGAKQ